MAIVQQFDENIIKEYSSAWGYDKHGRGRIQGEVQVNATVPPLIRTIKSNLGLQWRFIIRKGMDAILLKTNQDEEIAELRAKVAKLSSRLAETNAKLWEFEDNE